MTRSQSPEPIPEALQTLARHLVGTPFEGQVWLVGGAVRDQQLGRPAEQDFDLVTEQDALELAERLHQLGYSDHAPVVYARFGTARLTHQGVAIEFVTARRESYDPTSRKPSVEPATLLDDAQRRDFTVNTLLRNLHTGELRDPLNQGIADLEARILRTPLDPVVTFRDDPLRMLRAVRFKHKLGFEPAPGLFEAVQQEAHRLKIISEERIRDEFLKMLMQDQPQGALADLLSLGLLEVFAPELVAMVGVDQGKWHHLDVWDHSCLVVSKVSATLTLRLAALLHDVGKPPTRTIDANGDVRFFGHEAVGADTAVDFLRRLKLSNEEIEPVRLLVKNHMRLGTAPKFTDAAARRLLRDLDGHHDKLLELVEADAASLKPGVRVLEVEPIRAQLAAVQQTTPVEKLESPLSGAEIMQLLGLEPGQQVGTVKRFLVEQVLEGTLKPEDQATARRLVLQEFGPR